MVLKSEQSGQVAAGQAAKPPRSPSLFRWKNPLHKISSSSTHHRKKNEVGQSSAAPLLAPFRIASPYRQNDEDDDGDLLPVNNYLEGDATGPYQRLFEKIFTFKARQLLLAIKYGDEIRTMMADKGDVEGQEYRQATLELYHLHGESIRADAEIELQPRRSLTPFFRSLTDAARSPDGRCAGDISIDEIAKRDSKLLVKYAKKLGFNVIDMDKPLCRSFSWDPNQNQQR